MSFSIRCTEFRGLPAVELESARLRAVVVYGLGPRLAWLSPRAGDNLLFWEDAAPPRLVRRAGPRSWALRGGHRVWTSRYGADEDEQTYANDDAAGSCALLADGVLARGAPCPETGTVRSLLVRVVRDDRLLVVNRVENVGNLLFGCGLWGLTCTRPTPTTRYVVPLGDGSSWDTASITYFRTWAGQGTGSFRDEHGALTDDAYVLTPCGRETKRMFLAPAGIIALSDPARGLTLGIRCPLQRGLPYPANANLALYCAPGDAMIEMETMGPFQVLKPGESLELAEEWTLAERAIAPQGAAARELCA
ncbi:MAG: hypothetical protein RMM29_07560 [Planctomycetota bacterium]|nr:DUF4380 domain-containing protein [Planctomycetota bacterium]MCX8039903.1 DUF4380 domain-containing protein [Planctomycetota bacterium]MDW8373485.1 hypothetical protein [Planctomycetota bacterium]